MRDRLMVGQASLKRSIQVRILVPQPIIFYCQTYAQITPSNSHFTACCLRCCVNLLRRFCQSVLSRPTLLYCFDISFSCCFCIYNSWINSKIQGSKVFGQKLQIDYYAFRAWSLLVDLFTILGLTLYRALVNIMSNILSISSYGSSRQKNSSC